MEPISAVHLLLDGKEVQLKSSRDAIAHKLAYVTEDRKGDGLILSNPIKNQYHSCKYGRSQQRHRN